MSTYLRSVLRDAAAGGEGAGAGGGGAGTGSAALLAAGGGSGGGAAAGGAGAGAGGTGDAAAQAAAAAAAKPKPFFENLYDGTGKIDKTALDRLPEHMKGHKDWLAKYDTIEAALTGGATAHAMAVKKALAPLPEGAPPEVVAERKAHLDTLNNVPKDPKGYGIVRPQDLPEMYWNEEQAGKFAQLAQKHSISPAAVKDLLALQLDGTRGEVAKGSQMEAEFYSKQNDAYNSAIMKQGIDPEKAKSLSERGAVTLGIDPKSPIFKNADVRLACLRMANLVSEDKMVSGDATGGGTGGATPRDQALDIARNPQNPLNKAWLDPLHPGHEAARARWNELYRMDGEAKQRRGAAA